MTDALSWAYMQTWRPVMNAWDLGILMSVVYLLGNHPGLMVIVLLVWSYLSKSYQDYLGWRTRMEQERA